MIFSNNTYINEEKTNQDYNLDIYEYEQNEFTKEEIEAFRQECLNRGKSCLAPITKMNRVLKLQYEGDFDLFTALEQAEALHS